MELLNPYLKDNFSNMQRARTYKIHTKRLVIRCYHPKDAVLLKTAIDGSLEHLAPWMPWVQNEPESLGQKTERLRKYRGQFDLGMDYVFGIFDKQESKLIGSTGLHTRAGEFAREIGYWIAVNHLGEGYASEAVSALIKVGFEIEGLERIEIHCTPENIRSQKIPKKLGFVNEAVLKDRITEVSGHKKDEMIWTLFKEDYQKSDLRFMEIKAFDSADKEINW